MHRMGRRVSEGRVRGDFDMKRFQFDSEDENEQDDEHESLLFPSPQPLSPRGVSCGDRLRGARGRQSPRMVVSCAQPYSGRSALPSSHAGLD
jgi:hypothetical protein